MVYDDYDLAKAARKALAAEFGERFAIMYENVEFEEPDDGSMWLKFDYLPADKIYRSLDRKCIALLGMVQVKVIFSPGRGVDEARALAKDIANFFKDGKILDVGFILEGARSHPILKANDGWSIPVRFTVRYDEKES